jgi:hypothetical protein
MVNFKKAIMLRNYLKRIKLVLRLNRKKTSLVYYNSSSKNAKTLNLTPDLNRYKKYSVLSHFLVLGNIINILNEGGRVVSIDKTVVLQILNSQILFTKMLKIFRKAQSFCIIKITSTNVFLTITNGCGEVRLSCSAGQVGFIKRKTRKKFLVFVKMIEYAVFKLGFNLLTKIDRLSFINTPKFVVHKVVIEFITRGISLNKI